ncbi:MAG: bifunctional 3,4-dihydroxy-2-butanone-4-phosphate synthase/GTP cyclohydrolase II [Candidatus Marinimicrobia bacterium]|nr:bifunctional 3,4-dihydroxy-2-butanone-4-phosphate synthase/GTP cyclohydrolase II [Candidatus Neomarinimicrobiota bacterium]|tara:strand:+ start:34242 stop:35459 length:1218 start_codon:yes stop_codon:yes gene_type:complete
MSDYNKKIKEAIKDFKAGKMVIVVDDKDRENEGDFIISAELCTSDDINFMMKEARGLICASITNERANQLKLSPMVSSSTAVHETNFTVSVDAIKNATTGISAKDRWETVRVLMDEKSKPEDLGRPGHMFPLIAKEGGVLQRAGHTEAAMDLSKLSGLKPGALLVEIVNDDGTMARSPQLEKIAQKFDLCLISISDLIKYRRENDKIVEEISRVPFPTEFGDFELRLFEDKIHKDHHVAIVKGEISNDKESMVRVHSQCLTGDIFGSLRCDCGLQLNKALELIDESDNGVLVYLRQEGRGIGLKNKIKAYQLQDQGLDTVQANHELGFKADLREYGIGAEILIACGVGKMKLLTNNPKKIIGLDGFGLQITGREPINFDSNPVNEKYLTTKRDKLGHLILGNNEK